MLRSKFGQVRYLRVHIVPVSIKPSGTGMYRTSFYHEMVSDFAKFVRGWNENAFFHIANSQNIVKILIREFMLFCEKYYFRENDDYLRHLTLFAITETWWKWKHPCWHNETKPWFLPFQVKWEKPLKSFDFCENFHEKIFSSVALYILKSRYGR